MIGSDWPPRGCDRAELDRSPVPATSLWITAIRLAAACTEGPPVDTRRVSDKGANGEGQASGSALATTVAIAEGWTVDFDRVALMAQAAEQRADQ